MPTELNPLLRNCLNITAARLSGELRDVFSLATVTRYLATFYEQVGDRHFVGPNFLPVIIERFARERLWAIAQPDGRIEKQLPELLFVCGQNGGQGQMAGCLARHLSRGGVAARSAGSHPDTQADPVVVQAMAEIGLDVRGELLEPLTDAAIRAADVIVTLGCGDACPVYPSKRYRDWPGADPAGRPLEAVRRIRYELFHRVWELIETLAPTDDQLDLHRQATHPR